MGIGPLRAAIQGRILDAVDRSRRKLVHRTVLELGDSVHAGILLLRAVHKLRIVGCVRMLDLGRTGVAEGTGIVARKGWVGRKQPIQRKTAEVEVRNRLVGEGTEVGEVLGRSHRIVVAGSLAGCICMDLTS